MKKNIEYEVIRSLGPNVFLISIGELLYVLKSKKKLIDHSDLLEKLFYPILVLRFRKELLINIHLTDRISTFRVYPRLFFHDRLRYMIIEYVKPKSDEVRVSNKTIIDAYLNFQKSLDEFQFSSFNRLYNLNYSVVYLLIRYFFITFSFSTIVTTLKLLINLNKQQTKFSPHVLHKDLKFKKNIIFGKNQKVYFIDFETVTVEKKWILLDIVDMAFNPLDFTLDLSIINLYLDKIENSLKNQINTRAQIRFALLRRNLGSHGRELGHVNNSNLFFTSIILSEKKFNQWMLSNAE